MNWSPFDIKLMLHIHCSPTASDQERAPIYAERRDMLIKHGLVTFNIVGGLESTTLGAALVAAWCETPIPVVKYVDPRFEDAA